MNFNKFISTYQKTPPILCENTVPQRPLVSICVITYNHEKYIEECLESILSQNTDFEYEILIGEDNSTDATRNICQEYAEKYSDKIKLYLQCDENKIEVKGIKTPNFNALYLFYQAKGKFITYCEGDDYWTDRNKLKLQVKALMNQTYYSCCYHSFQEKFELSLKKARLISQPKLDISSTDLMNLKYHPQLSTICYINSFSEIPEEMTQVINLDSFFISLLGLQGGAKYIASISPNIYRRHSEGLWTGRTNINKMYIKLNTYHKLEEFYAKKGKLSQVKIYRTQQKNIYRALFMLFLKRFNMKQAIQISPQII